jgi:long-subunit acyl-CoA synthetase (AMP-forming)
MTNKRDFDAGEDDKSLIMYASGTMGVPKCVQLTHKHSLLRGRTRANDPG